MTRREFFQRRIPRYRKDPLLFFKEVTHFEPDPWQREAAVAVSQHRRVAIRSGQGVGKTALEANLMWWFIACFSYPRIVCTAPTMQQLDNVLWAEMAKWLDASPVLQMMFTWTKTRVYMNGYDRRWFAVPRTATKPESLQGFHEDNMLFVVDEASGVADPILDAIGGTLTGANNRLLYCGNPTKATGGFAESFQGDGMDCFVQDDDGNGTLRGELVGNIQRCLERRDADYQTRWNRVWASALCQKYRRPESEDYWLWARAFFDAPIFDLQAIAALVQ